MYFQETFTDLSLQLFDSQNTTQSFEQSNGKESDMQQNRTITDFLWVIKKNINFCRTYRNFEILTLINIYLVL